MILMVCFDCHALQQPWSRGEDYSPAAMVRCIGGWAVAEERAAPTGLLNQPPKREFYHADALDVTFDRTPCQCCHSPLAGERFGYMSKELAAPRGNAVDVGTWQAPREFVAPKR